MDPWRNDVLSDEIAGYEDSKGLQADGIVEAVIGAVVAVLVAYLPLFTLIIKQRSNKVNKRSNNNVKQNGKGQGDDPGRENLFGDSIIGEFTSIPANTLKSLSAVCGLAISAGGYFGVSVTDDAASVRLAIRHGHLSADKRFHSIKDLDGALATCFSRLRSLTTDDGPHIVPTSPAIDELNPSS